MRKSSEKTFFHKGDMVAFRGLPDSCIMKVMRIEWEKDKDGNFLYTEKETNNGKVKSKILSGIIVGWFDGYGNWVEKLVDSRSIFLYEKKVLYYLQEAKRVLLKDTYSQEVLNDLNNLINKF